MKTLLTLLFMLCASVATAATELYPSLFNVSGVSANDVLNVRAAPNGQAAIVGTLAANARNIEVVADQNGWGRINVGEQSGWVSMRYLTGTMRLTGSPAPITTCYGTEPFWGINMTMGAVIFDQPGAADETFQVTQTVDASTLTRSGLAGDGFSAIIRTEMCNDGMSDRTFGLSIDALKRTPDGWMQYSGCCSIQP